MIDYINNLDINYFDDNNFLQVCGTALHNNTEK